MSVRLHVRLHDRAVARMPLLLASALAVVAAASCSTEESIRFGSPNGGGSATSGPTTGSSATTGSGAPCTVNPMCKVSFKTDVFAGILDGPAGCTGTASCHGSDAAPGNMILKPGDAEAAYLELTNFQLKPKPGPAGAYVAPCDKMGSRLLCNMTLATGDNSFGACGTAMPLALGTAMKLTQMQLDTLAEWIACGAPDN
jgi:hypothetical protein